MTHIRAMVAALTVLIASATAQSGSAVSKVMSSLRINSATLTTLAAKFKAADVQEKIKAAAKALKNGAEAAAEVWQQSKKELVAHAASIKEDTLVSDVKWLIRYEKNMRAEAKGAQDLIHAVAALHESLDPLLDQCLEKETDPSVTKMLACLSSVPGRELLSLGTAAETVRTAALAKADAAAKLRKKLEQPAKPAPKPKK